MKNENQTRLSHLQDENTFLKMKMMLEKGAVFTMPEQVELPPEVENAFLKQVMAYEKFMENPRFVPLFDKVGRPGHFLPVDQIPASRIEESWAGLQDFLLKKGIEISVGRTDIGAAELYRFVTEELFNEQVEDFDLPGTVDHFVYDSYHPHPAAEIVELIEWDFLPDIFSKSPLLARDAFATRDIRCNGTTCRCFEELQSIMQRFKERYDHIVLESVAAGYTGLPQGGWHVEGELKGRFCRNGNWQMRQEPFQVELREGEMGYWVIAGMQFGNLLDDQETHH